MNAMENMCENGVMDSITGEQTLLHPNETKIMFANKPYGIKRSFNFGTLKNFRNALNEALSDLTEFDSGVVINVMSRVISVENAEKLVSNWLNGTELDVSSSIYFIDLLTEMCKVLFNWAKQRKNKELTTLTGTMRTWINDTIVDS